MKTKTNTLARYNRLLEKIATENFETVETLDNDFTLGSLRDIHEVTVDEIKAALHAAYKAGMQLGTK